MSALTRILTAIALVALLVVAAFYRTGVEPAQHSRALERLEALRLLDAQADIRVMQLRQGMLHNYDALAELGVRLEQHKRALDESAASGLAAGDETLASAIAQTAGAVGEKIQLLDDFKLANAKLRNSLHYFPRAAQRAVRAEVPASLRASTAALRDAVLLIPLQASGGRYHDVAQAASTLRADWEHTAHWPQVAEVAEHAQHIVALQREVDRLLARITREPPAQALARAYQARLDGAIGRDRAYRYALLAICATLLVCAALSYARLKRNARELAASRGDLHHLLEQQERRTGEIAALADFGRVLQSCVTIREAYDVVEKYCRRLLPSQHAALYVKAASGHFLEKAAVWGAAAAAPQVFAADDCWALRRGQLHAVDDGDADVVCRHVHETDGGGSYRCVPLIAQNDTIGVLHLATQGAPPRDDQLAVMVSEQVALTLANIRLRENLKQQSIRDALTGLYNRRYLEESLAREVARAEREGTPLAVLMFDIDHFKRYNDVFGHSAGDLVIQTLGRVVRENTRESDIACRYGGEEFLLLMPSASLEVAAERAEALRALVHGIELSQNGQTLGRISISVGVSAFPQHGCDPADLVKQADAALYNAKRAGRDRVEIAGDAGKPPAPATPLRPRAVAG